MKEWIAAIIIAIVMSTAYMLDGNAQPITFNYERPTKSEAYKTCAAIGGPNAWFKFDKNDKLICTNKRGDKLWRQP